MAGFTKKYTPAGPEDLRILLRLLMVYHYMENAYREVLLYYEQDHEELIRVRFLFEWASLVTHCCHGCPGCSHLNLTALLRTSSIYLR
jgi:hypothetical protein